MDKPSLNTVHAQQYLDMARHSFDAFVKQYHVKRYRFGRYYYYLKADLDRARQEALQEAQS